MQTQLMQNSGNATLKLNSLHERHSGLTPALSDTFYEAASVCLNRHHKSPVEIEILRNGEKTKRITQFQEPDARAINAWANDIDTTETGAYGVCLAAVEAEEQMVAVKRAETLSGADWYVAPVGTEPDDLESCFRLEISGIDAGNRSAVSSRLLQKVNQTRQGASNLPAIASVVGFKERAVAIQRVSNSK
jgi:hypothetical protein